MSGNSLQQKKLVHDGISSDVWDYTITNVSGQVIGPDGLLVKEDFFQRDSEYGASTGGTTGFEGLVYRTTRSMASNNQKVAIVERQWQMRKFTDGVDDAPNGSVAFNPVVTKEFTTLCDASGNEAQMSAQKFEYDFNGNRTSVSEYDFFSPGSVTRDSNGVPENVPGSVSPVRTTTTSFYTEAPEHSSSTIYAKRLIGSATPVLSAPKLTTVGSAQTEFHYDGIDNTPPSKGNLTKARQFVEGSTWIQTTHAYDPVTGNRTSTTDPKGNITQFFYDATKALPSSVVIDPLNGTGPQTTSTIYDFPSGLPSSVTDANQKTTTIDYTNQLLGTVVDPFGRPGIVTDPQGRRSVTRYFDSNSQPNNTSRVEVWSDLNSPDALLKSRSSFDQLGRVVKTESTEDGVNYTMLTDTVYQQMGKITIATNPMRSQSAGTDGWTRVTKDDYGRVFTVETFSGRYPSGTATGVVTTSYNAEQTTVTDQAGKVRRSITDGLGRLKQVIEDPNLLAYQTNYSYDALDDLTGVTQGGQTRTFVYDSLKRLKQAFNPESGTIIYTHDDNSNLQTKTDARGVITTYGYDGLNRVTTRTYSGPAPGGTTPGVTYTYDTLGAGLNGKGRLTSVSSSVSSYSYGSYDVMGRVVTGTQTTDGQSYSMSYQYNLAGGLTSETYPSGRQVLTEYDSAGRAAGVKAGALYYAGAAPTDNVNRIQYAAHGAISATKLGNGKWEHTNFNSRLQPTQIGLGTSSADSSLLRLDYTYGTTNNNGNVQSQRIVIAGSLDVTQNYTYDEVNRLKTANESSGASWAQTYDYDRFGNRAVRAGSHIPEPALTPQSQFAGDMSAFDPGNNRIVASQYDPAGNQIVDALSRTSVYDGENRQTTFNGTGGQYFYDGDGRRVKKIDGSGITVFVYNAGGQLIAEYHNDPAPPAAGGGGTSYLTSDHLGSTRVVTTSSGTVKARYDYLAFGEELGSGIGGRTVGMGYSGADSTRQKFTQKERDSESELDYFGARYYSGAQGRFTSVDPILSSGRDTNPQSWNRYVYVFDNPMRWVDPSGLDPEADEAERKRQGEQAAADFEVARAAIDEIARNGGNLIIYVAGILNPNQDSTSGSREVAAAVEGWSVDNVVSVSNRSGLRDGRSGAANAGTAQAVAKIVEYALGKLDPHQISIIAHSNGAPSLAKGLETVKNHLGKAVEFNSIKLYAANTSDKSVISSIGEFAKPGGFSLTVSKVDVGLFAADWFNSRDVNRSAKEWKRALQNVDVRVIETRQLNHLFKAYVREEFKGKTKTL